MKIGEAISYGFGKICIGLLRVAMHVYYMPKGIFRDKKIQSNRMKKPSVVILNHTSTMDPPVILSILTGKVTCVVAKDWYEKKSVNWIMKAYGAIPVDRYSMDMDWMSLAWDALKKGTSVVIFPEGKTRKDGELNEFKSGFVGLAQVSKCPVVCIGLDGIYKFGHRVHYVVDVPEMVTRGTGPAAKAREEKSEYFRQKVKALKAQAIAKKKFD